MRINKRRKKKAINKWIAGFRNFKTREAAYLFAKKMLAHK